MEINFTEVLLTVLSIVLLMVPGFILAKIKLFTKESKQTISNLVLYVCQTMLVFMAFQSYEYNSSIALNMLYVAGLALAVHMIMIVVVNLVVRGDNELKLRCVRYGGVLGNCGFMGIPMLKMLFGTTPYIGEILIYTAVVLTVFNIVNWTFGVYMMSKDKKQISIKKILLNPVLIAVFLGLLSFLVLKKPIVDLAKEGSFLDSVLTKLIACINYFGEAVTPLSMTVVGMSLADSNIKELFMDKLAYLQSFLKLIVASLVAILLVAFIPIDATVKYTVFFTMAMPAAASTTLFAVKFEGDNNFASVCVLLSTILSVISIPLMYLLISGVFGVTI